MKYFYFSLFFITVLLFSLIVTLNSHAEVKQAVVYHPRTNILKTNYDERLNIADSENKNILWLDLKKQRLSIFRNQEFITSYQVITGKNLTPTPTGIFKINYKLFKPNEGIQLYNKNTKTVKVSYWMPFVDDSIAFHNASWRNYTEFGKISRRPLNGSKGCVNMSYSDSADLFSRIEENDIVVSTN